MPKMKTNKSAAKRFKVSGTGRVRRPKAGGNHLLQEKSRKRLRRLRKNDMVNKTLERKIKRLIPYGFGFLTSIAASVSCSSQASSRAHPGSP